jgi:oxygen-dependent protoporphyrinogen oxidase
VVVVGGGIAGLAAAWELTGGEHPDPEAPLVSVLESGRRLGGPLRSEAFAGAVVDVGPDGFLARRPEAADLAAEVGLGDRLRPVGASGASVYVRGALRRLPQALLVGVPTRWWPVARSGILGPLGTARLLRDLLLPRPDRRGPLGDRALGPLVARRLGRAVVDVLVDPLIGGIHAGSVADMSTAAVMPVLLAVSGRRSLMRGLRRASPAPGGSTGANGGEPGPVFLALDGGMGSLVDALAARLRERGVTVSTQRAVERLVRAPGGDRWLIETTGGPLEADGVVLAVPATAAADLLAPLEPDAAALERTVEYGSVAVVTLSYPAEGISLPSGTGFLVPRHTPSPLEHGDELLLTAGTFLDAKWPHLARPGRVLLRASVGRFGDRRAEQMGDTELSVRVAAELDAILGLSVEPSDTMVTRWRHSFPQYRVGHLLRVSGVEAAVKRLPTLAVAGSAYRGVGIPACIASGREAARAVRRALESPQVDPVL